MHYPGASQDPGTHEASMPDLEIKKSGKGRRENPRESTSREPNKLRRERRTYSFSPGRNDSIRVPKDIHRQHPVPPLPKNMRRNTEGMVPGTNEKDWQRVPTLHKRSRNGSPRRRSSKKRKEDHDREAEVRAMSSSIPTRAATEYGFAGRPMKKDSKRMRGGLGRNFTNPSSDISLPVPESLHSSMSSGSERRALYKLKGMDLFAPRPTIRYADNPRYAPGITGWGSDDESKKRRVTGGEPIPEEVIKAKKRIDDLADDLDAGDLRELMERDTRRRERKKLSDQEKMQRRLTRRAEKQKVAEAEAAANGTSPPKNMERGVMGRELVGLGIDPVTSTRRASDASARRRGKRPAELELQTPETSPQKPASNFQRSESLAGSDGASPTEEQEPVIATARLARLSRASLSPPSSPKGHKREDSSISQMMELAKAPTSVTSVPSAPAVPEQPLRTEPSRTSSELSTSKPRHLSWTSFFKRNSKTKRGSIPSSFSNTSRESTAASATPLPYAYSTARASVSSGVPKRTMSRFREDLPENRMPISPPDSRVQSPDTDVVPQNLAALTEKKSGRGSLDTPSPFGEQSRTRYDTPTSGYRSPEATRNRDIPGRSNRSVIPSPEPTAALSQSLASIDSEASWLSGRPRAGSKRSSAQVVPHPIRDSASSLQKRYNEYSESAEELGIAEDEYFGRLTPGPEEEFGKFSKRRASGNPMPSSDEEDGGSLGSPGEKFGAVGKRPRVVHSESRAKSREGILNDFDNDSDSDVPGDTPTESHGRSSFELGRESKSDEPTLARATSVNLGKGHVRHLSAGSARLLDVKPRASGESKRLSVDPPRPSTDSKRLDAVEGDMA